MNLENLNPNKRNTYFTCRGTKYWIGHGGFISDEEGKPVDVPEAHTLVLLQGKAWRALSWDPEDPKYAKRVMPGPTGVGLGRRPRTRDELKWEQGIRPKTNEELGGQTVTVGTKDGKPTGSELVETKPPTTEEIQKAHKADIEKAKADAQPHKLVAEDGNVVGTGHGAEDTGLLSDVDDTGLLGDGGESVSGDDTTREIETATAPTWTAPAEGEEWPDPVAKMPIKFLREMADAYEVKYTQKAKAKTLITKITKAMYDE